MFFFVCRSVQQFVVRNITFLLDVLCCCGWFVGCAGSVQVICTFLEESRESVKRAEEDNIVIKQSL